MEKMHGVCNLFCGLKNWMLKGNKCPLPLGACSQHAQQSKQGTYAASSNSVSDAKMAVQLELSIFSEIDLADLLPKGSARELEDLWWGARRGLNCSLTMREILLTHSKSVSMATTREYPSGMGGTSCLSSISSLHKDKREKRKENKEKRRTINQLKTISKTKATKTRS